MILKDILVKQVLKLDLTDLKAYNVDILNIYEFIKPKVNKDFPDINNYLILELKKS